MIFLMPKQKISFLKILQASTKLITLTLDSLTTNNQTTMPLEINEDGLLVLQASGWDNDVDVAPEGMEGTKYTITGHQSQVITFKLSPGEMLRTEAGIMLCATEGISPESEFVGCSGCCSGEGCCYVNYKNDQDVKDEYISCTPNFPTAKVVPVDLVCIVKVVQLYN